MYHFSYFLVNNDAGYTYDFMTESLQKFVLAPFTPGVLKLSWKQGRSDGGLKSGPKLSGNGHRFSCISWERVWAPTGGAYATMFGQDGKISTHTARKSVA